MGLLLQVSDDLQQHDCPQQQSLYTQHENTRPTLLVWSPRVKKDFSNAFDVTCYLLFVPLQMDLKHLKHVYSVFERVGYQTTENNSSAWDVLWAHDYPFQALQPALTNLQPNQRVNKFPGTGYITTKVSLATSTGGLNIPPAFRLPDDKEKFISYVSFTGIFIFRGFFNKLSSSHQANANPKAVFVEKNNDHRLVALKPVSEINLDSKDSFVQEFVANPLLISGHKFDIGVYTIITSIDPLRIYKFDGDVLFR